MTDGCSPGREVATITCSLHVLPRLSKCPAVYHPYKVTVMAAPTCGSSLHKPHDVWTWPPDMTVPGVLHGPMTLWHQERFVIALSKATERARGKLKATLAKRERTDSRYHTHARGASDTPPQLNLTGGI
ncbi:hypothetical protein Bbelb_266680 [Branchiostoma belcheri]|nr:hypothetical protein Bbelb_266680 [Branchiostoma belcheri]